MTDSKYTQQRLTALYDQVESLEHALEAAGAILEAGIKRGTERVDAKVVLQMIRIVIVQDFQEALLASRETTDEQLDYWIESESDAEKRK